MSSELPIKGKTVESASLVYSCTSDPAGTEPRTRIHFTDGFVLDIFSQKIDIWNEKREK